MNAPNLKLVSPDQPPALDDLVPVSEMSEHAQRLLDYANRKKIAGQTMAQSRQTIVEQFKTVFEMIGGVPRLALWADQNPDAFFAHYAKLLPAQAKLEMTLPNPDEAEVKDLTTEQLKLLVLRKAADSASLVASDLNATGTQ